MLGIQHEAKMSTLTETIQDIESKKRELQDSVDTLSEEVAKRRAAGTFPLVTFPLLELQIVVNS